MFYRRRTALRKMDEAELSGESFWSDQFSEETLNRLYLGCHKILGKSVFEKLSVQAHQS